MERERKMQKVFQHRDSMIRDSTQRNRSRTESFAIERALTRTKLNVNNRVEVFDSHAYDTHTIPKKEPSRPNLRRHNTIIDWSEKIENLTDWSASENEEDESTRRYRSVSMPQNPDRLGLQGELTSDDLLQSPSGRQQMRDARRKVNDKISTGLDVIDLKSDEESINENSDKKERKKSAKKKMSTVDNRLPPILETTHLADDDKKPLSGAHEKRNSVIETLELLKQQENEALGKLQLVKRIQSKARSRPKYKPYYSELGPVRSTRPPQKLAPIPGKQKATANEVNHAVTFSEKEPLLDNRFVSLMRSLTKKM
eukprot:Seg1740.14 transcript_id=Seg1740.14/GoldUCD/mRNA.D3Y31 product="hypothetical protein" protein_id=Seg1740.14/GoldUCD/D3Y31